MRRKVRLLHLVDAHCHLHDFTDTRIRELAEKFTIVAVSDDEPSSIKTLRLAETYDTVIPCVGVHPWCADKVTMDEVERTCRLAERALCIGEVGLDTKFVPDTIERQREIFTKFLQVAREYSLPVNLHSAGTWREVYEMLLRYDIERAVFHWYTGPLDLLEDIVRHGFYVSINVAVKIQKKHQEVAKRLPLENMLLESDGPYTYRGLELEPGLIQESVKVLSQLLKVDSETIVEKARSNLARLFRL